MGDTKTGCQHLVLLSELSVLDLRVFFHCAICVLVARITSISTKICRRIAASPTGYYVGVPLLTSHAMVSYNPNSTKPPSVLHEVFYISIEVAVLKGLQALYVIMKLIHVDIVTRGE